MFVVRTIHEKVDDTVHAAITAVKEDRDKTWEEFFAWLAEDLFGSNYHEIASMSDAEIKRNLSNAVEQGEWLYVARFAIEADSRDLTVVGAEVSV